MCILFITAWRMDKKKIVVSGAAAITILIGVPVSATAANAAPVVQNDSQFSLRQRWLKRQHITQATLGTVTSARDGQFAVVYKTGGLATHVTVTVTPQTKYKQNGKMTDSFLPEAGQRVVVMGMRDQLGNIPEASSVNLMVRTPRTAV